MVEWRNVSQHPATKDVHKAETLLTNGDSCIVLHWDLDRYGNPAAAMISVVFNCDKSFILYDRYESASADRFQASTICEYCNNWLDIFPPLRACLTYCMFFCYTDPQPSPLFFLQVVGNIICWMLLLAAIGLGGFDDFDEYFSVFQIWSFSSCEY